VILNGYGVGTSKRFGGVGDKGKFAPINKNEVWLDCRGHPNDLQTSWYGFVFQCNLDKPISLIVFAMQTRIILL
jgi:hypothetical protein